MTASQMSPSVSFGASYVFDSGDSLLQDLKYQSKVSAARASLPICSLAR